MTLRISLNSEHTQGVLRVIEKNLPSILGNTKKAGSFVVPDWQDRVSEAALTARDTPVSTSDNLVNFGSLGVARKMTHIIQAAFPDKVVSPSGFFHYPPTGFMGWHTNSDVACQRLYITWTPVAGKSFFRYVEGGTIKTDYDDAGLTLRLFDIPSSPPHLWHCVGSETDRISIGYRLK